MVTNPYTEHPQALDRAANVKLLVLDVDGVLTDGSLLVGQDGKEILAKDAVADDKFLGGIKFYVKGVEGKVPN